LGVGEQGGKGAQVGLRLPMNLPWENVGHTVRPTPVVVEMTCVARGSLEMTILSV
jgi:hypothetical protein